MRKWTAASVLLCCGALVFGGENSELRELLRDEKYADGWIYDDIDAGYAKARTTGKPLLVCFCCVP